MHTAEPVVPVPSSSDEIAIENWEHIHCQIPVELIQAGDNILHSEIHKLIDSIWEKKG
jgi:hypothetical protein